MNVRNSLVHHHESIFARRASGGAVVPAPQTVVVGVAPLLVREPLVGGAAARVLAEAASQRVWNEFCFARRGRPFLEQLVERDLTFLAFAVNLLLSPRGRTGLVAL